MKIKELVLVATAGILLSACASKKDMAEKVAEEMEKSNSNLPSWVTMPVVEDGFADTQCVNATIGDMNILKNKATALARAEIAKQINIQVKAMDKTYQNLTETSQGVSSGGTFESVSKQVTNQKLAGSRPVKMDYVDFPDNTQKMCVMVAMNPAITQALYKEIVSQTGRQLSPQSDAVLFQEFKAYKATQEMDAEIEKQ